MTKANKYDVFDEGDRVPFNDAYATVVSREVVSDAADLPDELAEWQLPSRYLEPYFDENAHVVLSLDPDDPDTDAVVTTAEALTKTAEVSFTPHSLPSIMSETRSGAGVNTGEVRVSVPAVGSRSLRADEAESLAAFLRVNKDFAPLHVLLSGASSAEEVEVVAAALDRAADAARIASQID